MQPSLRDIPVTRSRAKALAKVDELCVVSKSMSEFGLREWVEMQTGVQKEIFDALYYDDQIDELIIGGGAGGGKTTDGVIWGVDLCLRYPGIRGLFGRDELKRLKETTLNTFYDICKKFGLRSNVDYVYNATNSKINFSNGSEILLVSTAYMPTDRDFQRLGGLELTWAFLDEIQTSSPAAKDIIGSRIRYRNVELGIKSKLLGSCNPGPHWIKYEYVQDSEGQPKELPDNKKYIQLLLKDNPDREFAAAYEKKLQGLPEYHKARLLYGDWDAEERTGGEFCPDFDAERHTGQFHVEYDPMLPLHLTWDFNVHPYVTCLVHQVKGKRVVQIAELTLGYPDNNTKTVCRRLLSQYPQHVGGAFLYGDPSGRASDTRNEQGYNDYSIIQTELDAWRPSMRVDEAAPAVHLSGQFVNEIFKEGFGGISIFIDSKCRNTIRDFQNCKKDGDGTMKKTRVKDPKTGITYEPLGHCLDAIRYMLVRLFQAEYTKFQRGPVTFEATMGRRTLSKHHF